MKSKIFGLLIFILPVAVFGANGLTLSLTTGEDVSNQTYTVTGLSNNPTFEEDLYLTNNTDTTVKLRVRRKEISVNPNSSNYFCWYQCYSSTVNVDPPGNFILVNPAETDYTDFHSYFKPQGTFGVNRIRYTFFNNIPGHLEDSVFVEIVYDISIVYPQDPILLQVPNNNFVTNSDIYIDSQIDTSNISMTDIVYPLTIRNNSNTIKQIVVKKKEISVVDGTQNFFSWNATFNPLVISDTIGFVMFPNTEMNNQFKAIYRPNGKLGESIIQYTVYNKYDSTDFSFLNVHFNINYSGITRLDKSKKRFEISPNPAKDIANVRFNNSGILGYNKLSLYNSSGLEVASYSTFQNNLSVNTSELCSGLYFCTIIDVDGKSYTSKLIVAH